MSNQSVKVNLIRKEMTNGLLDGRQEKEDRL